ncbi:MAG: phosphoribosyltransferase family protein [Actinomycetota bacterium]|nr:phosphoribosyltransferase family protein [Actinomycetota bacterium]
MLLPTRCPLCRRQGPAPCRSCAADLRPAPVAEPPPGLDACACLLDYHGGGSAVVASLKFAGQHALVSWLAPRLAALVGGLDVDVVTWAPTSAPRRRARGFDQAELLATAVGRGLGVGAVCRLRRVDPGGQAGRARAERLDAVRFAAWGVAGARVVVVDDVVTTGATMSAASRALREAGARSVVGLVAARTPPASGGRSTPSGVRQVHVG